MRRLTIRIIGVVLCVAMVSSMGAAPAVAQTDEEQFLVELDADGDADVSVTLAYDLDSDDEQAAFEELQDNETAQGELSERFENRMTAVAEDASAATDREMSVSNVGIELQRDGDVGLVTLSLTWSNLAAVDDEQVTVTEPFASGFEPDQPFTVVAPDGYEITSATPDPSSSDGGSATWNAGTSLDGFEVVAGADDSEADDVAAEDGSEVDGVADEDDTEDAAGFGVVTGVLALLAVSLLAVRRRQ